MPQIQQRLSEFVVEQYLPEAGWRQVAAGLQALEIATAELAAEGAAIRYRGSQIVPVDEACFSLFSASSEEEIRRAYSRAGLTYDRIVAAVVVDPSG